MLVFRKIWEGTKPMISQETSFFSLKLLHYTNCYILRKNIFNMHQIHGLERVKMCYTYVETKLI